MFCGGGCLTRENLSLEIDTSLSSRRVTRSLEGIILRDGCINANWFRNLVDARAKITAWRDEYNGERPHSSLGYRTPNEFAETLKSSVMTG